MRVRGDVGLIPLRAVLPLSADGDCFVAVVQDHKLQIPVVSREAALGAPEVYCFLQQDEHLFASAAPHALQFVDPRDGRAQ